MSAFVRSGTLFVEFESGKKNQWGLPDQRDRNGIRKVRDIAVDAESHSKSPFAKGGNISPLCKRGVRGDFMNSSLIATWYEFARQSGASFGQMNAVKKALTDAGYYVAK
jgi:hypothetical protein